MPLSAFFLCVIYQIKHTCVSHLCFLGRISPITLMPVTFASCLDPVTAHICRKAQTHKIKINQVQSERQQQKKGKIGGGEMPEKKTYKTLVVVEYKILRMRLRQLISHEPLFLSRDILTKGKVMAMEHVSQDLCKRKRSLSSYASTAAGEQTGT